MIKSHRSLGYHTLILLMLVLVCCSGKKEKPAQGEVAAVENNTNKKLDENGIEIIDISDFKLTDKPFPMSEIVDPSDIQYIKLETEGDGLLPLVSQVKVVGDRVFLADGTGVKYVYQFDTQGKFINRLGKIGQGPGEYKLASDFAVCDSLLYLSIADRSYVHIYNINTGEFLQRIDNDAYNGDHIEVDGNKNILLIRAGIGSFYNMYTYMYLNKDGELLYKQVPAIKEELINEYRSYYYQTSPITLTNERILFFEALDNNIYEFAAGKHRVGYKLEMGKYTMPAEYIYRTKQQKRGDSDYYFSLIGLLETSSDIFIDLIYGGYIKDVGFPHYYARYNKKTGEVLIYKKVPYMKEAAGDIFFNDIDGGASVIIRNQKDDPNYLCTLIYPHMAEEYLKKWRDKAVKYPEKRAQLCKFLSEMGEDDNPILVLYKKK